MTSWPNLTGRIEGQLVVVEPLAPAHEEGLFAAGHDQEMWALGQLELADRAARALGAPVLPSALVADRRGPGPRYAAAYARATAAHLARRARERPNGPR